MIPLVLFLFGTTPFCAPAGNEARLPFGLYAGFQHQPSAPIWQAIQDELTAILVPIGAAPDWRALGDVRGGERWSRVVIVHFKGDCDLADLNLYAPYPWTLGRTYLNDGVIVPFSDIYCNSIRAFLAPELVRMDSRYRRFAYGRAVGRVLAHELYHILANTRHHRSGGLAEATYTAPELAADEFHFQDREMQQMRAAFALPSPRAAAWQAAAACRGAGQ